MNEDRATRYHRAKRRTSVASFFATSGTLAYVLVSGASITIRDFSHGLVDSLPVPDFMHVSAVVAIYVCLLCAAVDVVTLPLVFFRGFLLERRYGLSAQRFQGWAIDQLKSAVLSLALGVIASVVVYAAIRRTPFWWLWSAGAFSVATILLAKLAPTVLLPLFYRFQRIEHEELRARLLSLSARAGARILDVYEWKLGDKSRRANAALVGLGRTRRILLSDTLLADHTPEEIEVILAHELAHHVHGDIWRAIAFEAFLTFIGFFVADVLFDNLAGPLGLLGKSDVAGLPLLVLTGSALSIALVPLANALSRRHERRADRFALQLTRNAGAFVTAMRRLGARNLAEEQPSRLIEWLFYTHPPLPKRIEAAAEWKAIEGG